MTQLNDELLDHIILLSYLDCDESEREKLSENLNKIVKNLDLLQEIDTDDVPECHHIIEEIHSVLREDDANESLERDLFLENAPETIGGMVRVPTVVNK